MLKMPSKAKSHMNWSWVLMILFLTLSIIDFTFGVAALICMLLPLYHAFKGNGKRHCSHYCPRGSLYGKFLSKISFKNNLPHWMRHNNFRHLMLMTMFTLMGVSIYFNHNSIAAVGFIFFRFIVATSLVGILLGIYYNPRSWCQICPMGHLSGVVTDIKRMETQASKDKNVA